MRSVLGRLTSVAGLAVLGAILVLANVAGGWLLRGARIDLTEQRLYTLADGTRRILDKLDEPITLTLYYSQGMAAGRPDLQTYGRRVRELLSEYARLARGKITVRVIDPQPFSDEEQEARNAGLQPVAVADRAQFFFGLVGTNSIDGRETVPFFAREEERFLEYTLSRLVHSLANPKKRVLGVISALPIDGTDPRGAMGMRQQPKQPWLIMRELRSVFDVRMLSGEVVRIDDDVDALLVAHPKGLSASTLGAIEAFAVSGRSLVVFQDPLCESDIPPGAEANPLAVLEADRSSTLDALTAAWGLRMDPANAAADRTLGTELPSADRTRVELYPQFLRIGPESVDRDDPAIGNLARVHMVSAGVLEHDASSGTTFRPIVRTSGECMIVATERLKYFARPQELLKDFVPRGEPIVLAARLTGPVRAAPASGEPGPQAPGEGAGRTGTLNVVVFADADMLSDQMWVQPIQIGAQVLGYQKFADNGDLVLNVIEQMAGSSDLLDVRARGTVTRPFVVVDTMVRDAQQRVLSEQEQLESKRREAMRRISEIERARPGDGGMVILSDEQRAEIEKFQAELASTNKRLREINFEINRDVDRLGSLLKVINIAAAPAVVLVVAVLLGVARAARRRADRRATSIHG